MEIEITGTITVLDAPCVVFRMNTDGDVSLKVVGAMVSLSNDLGIRASRSARVCSLCPGYDHDAAPCRNESCPVPATRFIMRAEYVPLLQLRGLTVRSNQ